MASFCVIFIEKMIEPCYNLNYEVGVYYEEIESF